jgi:hypothetical protein
LFRSSRRHLLYFDVAFRGDEVRREWSHPIRDETECEQTEEKSPEDKPDEVQDVGGRIYEDEIGNFEQRRET